MQLATTAFRGTPFHRNTVAACRTTSFFKWDDYVVPDVYCDVLSELKAIRSAVSMNEMSPLPKIDVMGPDAGRLVDLLITRDALRLPIGHALFTLSCNDQGHVIGDGLVFRLAQDHYRMTIDFKPAWLARWSNGLEIEIRDVTHDYGILALQGPHSTAVLDAVTGDRWSDLPFSRIRRAKIGGAELDIARQGFTGERGYELLVRREDGYEVWDAIQTGGRAFGIQPAGEYAIDIARVEAGLVLLPTDYTPAHDVEDCTYHVYPSEIGLGRLVDFAKGEFAGKAALQAIGAAAARRTLVGLEIDWRQIAARYQTLGIAPSISPRVRWDSIPAQIGGQRVGRLSSATWSPTTHRMIGFGLLQNSAGGKGTRVEVEWRSECGEDIGLIPAVVTDMPFIPIRRSL